MRAPDARSYAVPRYAAILGYGALFASLFGAGLALVLALGTRYSWIIANSDFMCFYLGSHLWLTGQGANLYNLQTQLAVLGTYTAPEPPLLPTPFMTPPWTAILFAPLALIPYVPAYVVWLGLNLTLVGLALRRVLGTLAPPRPEARVLVLAVLAFTPLAYALWQGQYSVLIWVGLVEAWRALRTGREWRAGAWLALGLLKPQMLIGPLLVLLVLRRWRPLAVCGVALAALLILSFLALGNWVPGYLGFLREVGVVQGNESPLFMYNWRGLVAHLFGTDETLPAQALVGGLTLLTGGLLVVLAWPRRGAAPGAGELPFLAAILLGLLINPHLYQHDVTPGLLPGLVLWRGAAGPARPLRGLRALLIAGPFVFWVAAFGLHGGPVQVGAWYLAALAAIVIWAWPRLQENLRAVA